MDQTELFPSDEIQVTDKPKAKRGRKPRNGNGKDQVATKINKAKNPRVSKNSLTIVQAPEVDESRVVDLLGKIKAKQFPFVENPATVLLIPFHLGSTVSWWSHDGILLGGLMVNSVEKVEDVHFSRIGYLPTPIPRTWGQKEFGVVVEYEAESETTKFKFRMHYGCGDPSELHLGETEVIQGIAGKKHRVKFKLNENYIIRNELFRATLEIARYNPEPVLVYGAWLEIGV